MIKRILTMVVLILTVSTVRERAWAQQGGAGPSAAPLQTTPVMDGGAGPCSLNLTVTSDGKSVAAAEVKVHMAYGFAGVRRLDLDAYTGNDGKVRFVGLPVRVRRPPLEFRATKDGLAGTAVYDPETECHAAHEIVLVRRKDNQD